MTEVIIKTESPHLQEHHEINKVIGRIDAKNIAKLLAVVGLTANPRKSKVNKITDAIIETLRTSPKDLRFKSKGLLISTMSCQPLERGRFKISFEEPHYEGVLDGGHNMLAIGMFILEEYFGDKAPSAFHKVRRWDDFIDLWLLHQDGLKGILEVFDFSVPIEIIYPTEKYKPSFIDSVLDISDARNNNFALTAGTKADHRGYYEVLKTCLDPDINEKVQWKDGETNKPIRRDDIVAMALIPFIALQEADLLHKDIPTINPVTIYSSKGKCVELFSTIFEKYSDKDQEIVSPMINGALALLHDLPKVFDVIYSTFPRSARDNGMHFGRISSVKLYEKGKSGGTYLNKAPLTKFYREECEAKYSEGFIYPIVCSVHALIKIENDIPVWAVSDPAGFIGKTLTECTKMLVGTIKENNYDPNSIGKNLTAYGGMKLNYKFLLTKT